MMGTSTNWKLDDGSELAKADLNKDVNYNYDNSSGNLHIGIRSWNVAGWTAQDFSKFSASVYGIKFSYHGSGQHSVTIGSSGYSTLFLPYATTIPEGVKAFTGEISGEHLLLTELGGGVIPAETAVVLKAAAGIYTFVQTEADTFTGTNDLKGDIMATTQSSESAYYALAAPGGAVGFYRLREDISVPGFRSYLTIAASSSVKAFCFDNDATGIKETLSDSPLKDENIYNLAGQRLDKMQRGINIIGGKKVILK